MPSTASEGFPKVIAEAMNYGCLPIVSNVSSIGQYINVNNGFIVKPTTAQKLTDILEDIVQEKKEKHLKEKAIKAYKVAKNFTFEHYNFRIWHEVLELD